MSMDTCPMGCTWVDEDGDVVAAQVQRVDASHGHCEKCNTVITSDFRSHR